MAFVTPFVVYNSLVRSKAPLLLRVKDKLDWYLCGPTVYDSAHIGHARSYVCQDIVKRIFEKFNISVKMVMGMTDIDDKIIARAKETNQDWRILARHFEAEFLQDMKDLKVSLPTVITRVSDHIPEIIKFVQGIEKNGFAYTEGNSVYFDTSSFQKDYTYGKLQPLRHTSDNQVSQSNDDKGKKNPKDFVLWKGSSTEILGWNSPWGHGRPGWHIECSAMSSEIFGDKLDLHSGGIDLQFPHHDNEIAQCEAHFLSHQWCNYFIHTGHLHIQGKKMSKSLKNFTTIKSVLLDS